MSGDKPKKPFLGDEELSSELDAWDDMFDNLIAKDDAPLDPNQEVMAWPAPAEPPPPAVQAAPSPVVDDIDHQLTLDRAEPVPPPVSEAGLSQPTWDRAIDGRQETDFSEVGTEGVPAALGEMLGGAPSQVPNDFDDDDGVYTSASRPNLLSPSSPREDADDPVAPPPKPAPMAAKRTGPAIIRRTPVAVPILPQPEPRPDDGGFGEFAESTRIADVGEIEAKAEESRRNDARHKAPTAPPPMSFMPGSYDEPVYDDDDDGYEIEIGATNETTPEPTPAAAPRRTFASVVRRPEAKTTPPPGQVPARQQSEPLIEISRPTPAPAGEEDFGDVAASVQAADAAVRSEDDFSDFEEAPKARHDDFSGDGFDEVAASVGAAPILDQEVEESAIIDDQIPTQMVDENVEVGGGDAYVQMAPIEAGEDMYVDEQPVDQARDEVVAPPEMDRPPGLMDLYPRVKRPTSVPVLREAPPQAQRLEESPDVEPVIDVEAIGADSQWPEQVPPLPSSQLDEDAASMLLVYEREIPSVDEPTAVAALRIEAGRLCERVGDVDRARVHYDAALLADPRATAALRGLRRIARSQGDLAEATRLLDAEIAVAGALERRPLGQYRVDLLMASGENDLARVAVGELLDAAPSDTRALLAQLELAFLDGRADEFGSALEQLAHAVTDNELRAAVQQARGMLAAHHSDNAGAVTWFASAAESDPGSLGARLGAIREAAGQNNGFGAAEALLDLGRTLVESDPMTAAAAALRAQHWTGGETSAQAAELASASLPGDPLVARIVAETSLAAMTPEETPRAAAALAAWAGSSASAEERAFAAARAAELDPAHGIALWQQVLQINPGDDYAAAQLRTAFVASEQTQAAIDVDKMVAQDPERERARLRAAFGMIAQGELDDAIRLLEEARAAHPQSIAMAEALAEALAAGGRWGVRAKLLAELSTNPGEQFDRDVAQLRSALAWEEAVGAASGVETPDDDELQRTTAAALGAWEKVIDASQTSAPAAHAAAIVLATRLGDRDVLGEVLGRAQKSERSPWAASSLALRRARLVGDAAILDEQTSIDDPRRAVAQVLAATRRGDLAEASATLEERANAVDGTHEAAALRLRAAQIALDAGDAARATGLLRRVEKALPGVSTISDLLNAARRRAGDASGPVRMPREGSGPASPDEFARVIRDADDAAARGDGAAALSLYQSALEMRPGDPLAAVPLIRVAMQLRDPEPIAAVALAQLRAAETAGDGAAKAEAYELLAHIDKELKQDAGSAQIALESASQADPTRIDLMHRLEREYTVGDQIGDLLRLRRSELDQIPVDLARDRAAMIMDTAGLAERDQRPDAELAELYRSALEADPRYRLALLYLESIVRRAGASEELAKLEDQIAAYFEGDPRTQVAFYTRAGETLAELGKIDEAVQKFGRADEVVPGHVPALEGWRQAALKGQLWLDVAEAANRQAAAAPDAATKAALYHFAGVVLMDKALIGEQAMIAFKRALEADPSHRDAFYRLRIVLEEDADHDELAVLLEKRLDHEQDRGKQIELHRALANLKRNFLGDRDGAKKHYREILAADPNDLRSHAAVADIAWEQGAWQEAAESLVSRARLERDPEILKTLCFRLGLIYAERLVDVPMALKAFQRALTYAPDDENTLVRLAELATQAGEWKLALGACERLVKSEQDPDRRAVHLHRVARIFKQGFGDNKRAERALNLALDNAPTNDDALSEVVKFYRDTNDMVSVRVHLNRVAGTMRTRAANNPRDGVAYRVISRAMTARGSVGVPGSAPVAYVAAEIADMLGEAGEPERIVLAEPPRIDLAPLVRPDADDVLFPRSIQTEMRQIFTLLGDRIAKHVGVDLRAYGVARGDRLRARDSSVATHAQDVATALGFGEIDVYVSTRHPHAMVAEPTSPVSLVIGQAIAQADARAIRFAAGAALKLAQVQLAIPARLPPEELGILVVALLRVFQSDFPAGDLDEAAIAAQTQKLKRLIPTGLASELKPYALAIDGNQFREKEVARDLRIAGLRAGLIASGSLMAGLTILAAQAGTDVPSFLADPVAQGLITFALGEDHASLTR